MWQSLFDWFLCLPEKVKWAVSALGTVGTWITLDKVAGFLTIVYTGLLIVAHIRKEYFRKGK